MLIDVDKCTELVKSVSSVAKNLLETGCYSQDFYAVFTQRKKFTKELQSGFEKKAEITPTIFTVTFVQQWGHQAVSDTCGKASLENVEIRVLEDFWKFPEAQRREKQARNQSTIQDYFIKSSQQKDQLVLLHQSWF